MPRVAGTPDGTRLTALGETGHRPMLPPSRPWPARVYWRSHTWVRPNKATPMNPRTSSLLPPSVSLALLL